MNAKMENQGPLFMKQVMEDSDLCYINFSVTPKQIHMQNLKEL